MINIGGFGDSYIAQRVLWLESLQTEDRKLYIYGKGGANLFYAIHQWNWHVENLGEDFYDYAIFTFTWHHRLFNSIDYRNNLMCSAAEQNGKFVGGVVDDPIIKTEEDFNEFINTLRSYYKYIHDDKWRRFDYELELKYILELPKKYPKTKFIFLPNTVFSQELAKKYFSNGILVDFAFNEISENEPKTEEWHKIMGTLYGTRPSNMLPNNPYPGHMNPTNQKIFGDFIANIIDNYQSYADTVYPVDYNIFDIEL